MSQILISLSIFFSLHQAFAQSPYNGEPPNNINGPEQVQKPGPYTGEPSREWPQASEPKCKCPSGPYNGEPPAEHHGCKGQTQK